jgi:hypothetical protein
MYHEKSFSSSSTNEHTFKGQCDVQDNGHTQNGKYVVYLSTPVYLVIAFLFSGKCLWSKTCCCHGERAVIVQAILASHAFWV